MILSRAPLRITLGGGGTDLPSYYSKYGGFIVSAAIDKYVYIYVNRPAADDKIRVKYSKYEEVLDANQVEHDLVRPALKLLNIKNNVEIVSMADVPAGTGLGSSSTYLVSLLTALYELKRERVPTQALAEFACKWNGAGRLGRQDIKRRLWQHYLLDIVGRTGPSAFEHLPNHSKLQFFAFLHGISRSANHILKTDHRYSEAIPPY
jgi:D-glycero-alpha-D-manno-heptose-7-phosphate kinase